MGKKEASTIADDYIMQSFSATNQQVGDKDRLEANMERLRSLMNNPEVVNIAITGDWGIGKSTVIRNYERIYSKKFIHISTVDLISKFQTKNSSKDLETDIEKRLLMQLLVICNQRDIIGSCYKSIQEKTPTYITWGLPFLCSLMIVSLALYPYMKKEFLVSVAIIVFSLTRTLVTKYEMHRLKLSRKDLVEVEVKENSGEVPLNSNLTDLVYMMETIYKKSDGVLIIEDLDRCIGKYDIHSCISVLEKLREINILVNQRLRHKQKIVKPKFLRKIFHTSFQPFKFIYELNDSIFEDIDNAISNSELDKDGGQSQLLSDKFKFFDAILPIMPQLGITNSANHLKEIWQHYHFEFEEKFIDEISWFLYDYRTIRAITNEFMVFKYPNKPIQAQLNNEVGDTALMALCIYKFLFPTEYYSIRRNCKSQLLSYLFATKLREIYENFENPMHIDSQPISDNRKNVLLNYMTIDVIPYLFQNSFTKDVFDIFSFLEDMFLDNHAPAIQEIPHINDYEKIFSRMEEYEKDCLLLYAAYFLELFQKFSYLEELKEELKHEVENIVQTLETKWHSDGDAENILQYAHQMLDNIT